MIFRWFYVSTSRLDADDDNEVVRDIISVSIPRNRSLNVTGALLFTGDHFAQYLEGDAEAVAQLQRSILDDLRHEDVRTIAEGEYHHRRFVTWSLAYLDPTRSCNAHLTSLLDQALHQDEASVESLADLLSQLVLRGRG